MAKSATFGLMHLGIAFGVTYTLTGSLSVAGAVTLVEPLCNTVAHYFFDRWWDKKPSSTGALPVGAAPAQAQAAAGSAPEQSLTPALA